MVIDKQNKESDMRLQDYAKYLSKLVKQGKITKERAKMLYRDEVNNTLGTCKNFRS